ncbi:MAG: long-chain fatty acid--CoA ligase [Deltaproteobacteria bacterium]|nr:long-chain fatty acid--CoA ligase [Deltaproteobacteria bacterium]
MEFERKTVIGVFVEACQRFKDRPAFRYRAGEQEFEVTYEKFLEDVLLLSRAFAKKKIQKGERVLLLSDNRYAWIVTDMALQSLGAISVPRGSDAPSQELRFILEHSGCSHLIFETAELLGCHEETIKGIKGVMTTLVIAGEGRGSWFDRVFSYADILGERTFTAQDRDEFLDAARNILPEDPMTIIYTSGTTGVPKGVVLTHANIHHNIVNLPGLIGLTEKDRWLSVLPTWHIFERTAEYLSVARGSEIVYSSIKTFAADLAEYKPTLVASVPRLWESLYNRIQAAVRKKGVWPERIFAALVWTSKAYRRNRRIVRNELPVFVRPGRFRVAIDRARAFWAMAALALPYCLARKKLSAVQERFGGRLRMAISGGGSLPAYLDEWIDALGIRIVNAYGMTECSPGIAGRGWNCPVFGTLGPPVPETELRIADDGDQPLPPGHEGEIQVRGGQVFGGYYMADEENRKAFTADGFFRTGDLGMLTVTGELVITGRSKEIIVLTSGENVDPSRIEATISMFPFVNDAVLVGQDQKGLGALIVPNMEELREYLRRKYQRISQETEDFLSDSSILEGIRKEMNKLLDTRKGFKPYEKLHRISFLDREFQLGEELTNTLKKKRHVIERKYKEIITRLFQ